VLDDHGGLHPYAPGHHRVRTGCASSARVGGQALVRAVVTR